MVVLTVRQSIEITLWVQCEFLHRYVSWLYLVSQPILYHPVKCIRYVQEYNSIYSLRRTYACGLMHYTNGAVKHDIACLIWYTLQQNNNYYTARLLF